jgi:CRISPR-associated endonuclease Csn1
MRAKGTATFNPRVQQTSGHRHEDDLPEKRFGRIANPTVHIGLNQVRKVVNALIQRYGHPAEVIVEVARELKQSQEQKQEDQKRQTDNQKRNVRLRTLAAELRGCAPEQVTHADIQRLILWEELSFDIANRRCPYSGAQISAEMVLGPQVEVEHILPFSRTLDDSLNNKTLAMRQANRIKGNRTPWDARQDFANQGWQHADIVGRAEHMPRHKRYRFAEDGYQKWLKGGEDKDGKGFLARALNDTRYMSRVAREYLSLVCPQNTRVIPGQMTALLRGKFGLNHVLGLDGEKNRDDHRHHAVDACVIGVTDQGMLQAFARASADTRQRQINRLVEDMPRPWPTYEDHVRRAVNHIWVSHKPDHGFEGAMMEETSYGIRRDGSIKQRPKADGSMGREIASVVKIAEPRQPQRHGVDAQGQPLPYKGYVGGSNYCIEITRDERGKWVGNVVSTFQAYSIVFQKGRSRENGLQQLRHPALGQNGLPLALRLVSGDTVRMTHEGKATTVRMVKVAASGQIWFAPVHEANVDARNGDKQDPFSYISKMAGSLQKSRARLVTVSPIGELHDPGFRE